MPPHGTLRTQIRRGSLVAPFFRPQPDSVVLITAARAASRFALSRLVNRPLSPQLDTRAELWRDVVRATLGHFVQRDIDLLRRWSGATKSHYRGHHVSFTESSVGGIPSIRIEPRQRHSSPTTLLYLHGGGYVMGSAAGVSGMVGPVVEQTGVPAELIEYRLAPEHPYPAAINDCLAAYAALVAAGQQVIVAGDSAGGALSLAVALKARDEGLPTPLRLILISPWVHPAAEDGSAVTCEPTDMLGIPQSRHWFGLYTGSKDILDPIWRDPLAAPLFADHRELPPTLIQLGASETLRDQILDLHRRMSRAGVPVTLEAYEGMFHDFQLWPRLTQTRTALAQISRYVRSALQQ